MADESLRRIAPALFALTFLTNIACSANHSPRANSGQWQPSSSIPGGSRRDLVGNPRRPGPFKYQLRIPAGARVAAHRHSIAMQVKVLHGSMFIIIGEPLHSSRAQHVAAGREFVIPADAWHDEWWDEETILEAQGVGPVTTVYKISPPQSPS